jgi:uracil phosphoribosyltransferase
MIYESSHPLIKTLINHLRDTKTDALRFRHTVMDISRFLVYEAFENLNTKQKEIYTWRGKDRGDFIDEENLLFVTILRAGMPMLEGVNELFPDVSSGFLAMKRDEITKKSVLYYDRVPECKGQTVILLDVMVATGGSLSQAIDLIKNRDPEKIISLNIISSPQGLEKITQKHPDVDIFIAQIDKALDANKFIIPGLGDAGDRSYNTPTKS